MISFGHLLLFYEGTNENTAILEPKSAHNLPVPRRSFVVPARCSSKRLCRTVLGYADCPVSSMEATGGLAAELSRVRGERILRK